MRVYKKGGKEYVSVTSILSLMYPFNKEGFEEWARSNGLSADWINEESKRIGTKVHSWVEDLSSDTPSVFHKMAISEKEESYYRAVEKFLSEYEVIKSEFQIFNDEYGFAGTVDALVKDKEGYVYVTDFKTWGAWRGKPPKSHSFGQVREQLTMYADTHDPYLPIAVVLFEPDDFTFKVVKRSNKWKKWLKNNNLSELDYDGAEEVDF